MYIAAINLMWLRRHDTRQQSFTPSLSLFAPFLDYKICVLQVMNHRSLATRLQVYLLSSMIQHSPPLGWPQQNTNKATMQVDTVLPGSQLCIRGGFLHEDSWTIQAPPPCNHPPSIFGGWAASAYGGLPETIWYQESCGWGQLARSNQIAPSPPSTRAPFVTLQTVTAVVIVATAVPCFIDQHK